MPLTNFSLLNCVTGTGSGPAGCLGSPVDHRCRKLLSSSSASADLLALSLCRPNVAAFCLSAALDADDDADAFSDDLLPPKNAQRRFVFVFSTLPDIDVDEAADEAALKLVASSDELLALSRCCCCWCLARCGAAGADIVLDSAAPPLKLLEMPESCVAVV